MNAGLNEIKSLKKKRVAVLISIIILIILLITILLWNIWWENYETLHSSADLDYEGAKDSLILNSIEKNDAEENNGESSNNGLSNNISVGNNETDTNVQNTINTSNNSENTESNSNNTYNNNITNTQEDENDSKENENSINNSNSGNSNNAITSGDNEDSKNNSNSENNKNQGSNGSTSNNITFDSTVAFIGDSRTQGFIMYNGLKNVQDYSYVGLMVYTAVTKKFVKTDNGQKITLLQDMKNKNIKTVYIMLGVNELGWSYPSVFKQKYLALIDEIRKVKPNCKIYVQSIIPVTRSKDQSDNIYNNTNIKKFNKLIQEVASEKNITYLDVASALVDTNGYLPENASTDGIHIGKTYCQKWLNYLKNNS